MQKLNDHDKKLAEFACAVCHMKMRRHNPAAIDCAWLGIDNEYCPDIMAALARNLHAVASNEQVSNPLRPKGLRDSAESLATKKQVKSDWISVEDRLPEIRVPVLTYGRKGAVGIGFIQPTSVTPDGKVYFYPRYGDNLPTHWMPLPEPPKDGGDVRKGSGSE